MIPMTNLYNFILSIFGRRENQNGSQHSSCTPLRAQSRAGTTKDYKFSNVPDRVRELEYPERLPSRLPKSFPLIRNPSQRDVLGSTANKGGVETAAFDVRREDSVIDPRAIPFNRRSSSRFDFHSDSEESLYMPSNDIVDLEEHLTMRKTRPGNISHSFTGAPRSMSNSNLRNMNARLRRFNSVPDNRRLPESCPPVTSSSQLSLSISQKHTPLRTKGIARARESNTNLRAQSRADTTKDYKFSNLPDRAREQEYPERLSSRLPKSFPLIRDPSQRQLLGSIANKEHLMLDKSLDFNSLESGNTNTRREDPPRDFRQVPAQKFHSDAGTQLDETQLNESSECEAYTMRQLQLRNNRHSTPGSLPHKRFYSKVPTCKERSNIKRIQSQFSQKTAEFMNFPERHRARYTLSSTKKYKYAMPGFQEKGDMTDIAHLKSDGINNWIAFRAVISEKFESMFKYLSKKKHHSIGNIMDANLHVYWMGEAGISADKDANMFRSFAGGKVVLTLAEYKCLLNRISTAYDLDYWDVLQKMATFQGNVFNDEEQIFFV